MSRVNQRTTITLADPKDGFVRVSKTHVVPMFEPGMRLQGTRDDGGHEGDFRVVAFDVRKGVITVEPWT